MNNIEQKDYIKYLMLIIELFLGIIRTHLIVQTNVVLNERKNLHSFFNFMVECAMVE